MDISIPLFFKRFGVESSIAEENIRDGDDAVAMFSTPVDSVEDLDSYFVSIMDTRIKKPLSDLLSENESFPIRVGNFTCNLIITTVVKDAQDIPYTDMRDVVVAQHGNPCKRVYFVHAYGRLNKEQQ